MKEERIAEVISYIIIFIIYIVAIVVPPIFGWYMILSSRDMGNIGYAVLQFVFGVIFLAVFVNAIREMKRYSVYDSCEFRGRLESIQKDLIHNQKILKRKESMDLRIEKLSVLNVLGYFEEELEEIERLKPAMYIMTPNQLVDFEMAHLGYLAATGKDITEQMELIRSQLKNMDIWDRFAYDTRQLKGYEYFLNGEWEKFLEWTERLDAWTTLEQVSRAYARGICYFHLGRFLAAEEELAFAKKWGEDTRFVSGANEWLEKLPDRMSWAEEKKSLKTEKMKAIRKNYCIMILIAVIFVFSNSFSPYCSSVETAYRIENHITLNRPVQVLYEQKIDDCGIVYIFDGSMVAHCVVDYRESDKGTKYKIEKMFWFYQPEDWSNKKRANGRGYKEKYIDTMVLGHVAGFTANFYRMDDSLLENNVPVTGVCCDPLIEDVTINGQALEILDRKEIGNHTFYIWQAKDIDCTNTWELDIKVERD